jgi:hypothetical protein
MMNPEVMKRMEDMAALILKIPVERREEAFAVLAAELPEEAVQHFREFVFLYHMFTDNRFYKAVEQTVCEMYCASINQ